MRNLHILAFLTAALIAVVIAPTARAQAFTQPEGHGRVITSVIWSGSDKGFDDNGHVTDIANYDVTQVYLLGEYGVTDDLTVLATPSFRSVSVKGGKDSTGLGYTDLGARYRVVNNNGFVFSLQGLVRIPGQTRRDQLAQIGQTNMEYDVRGQAGYSFGKGSFAILEGGYRFRAGQPPNEYHIDATVGIRATSKLLFLANSYNTVSDGRGSGIFSAYRYNNAYLSAAYDVSPKVTLQLGLQGTLAGRNALRERGVFGGVWFRF